MINDIISKALGQSKTGDKLDGFLFSLTGNMRTFLAKTPVQQNPSSNSNQSYPKIPMSIGGYYSAMQNVPSYGFHRNDLFKKIPSLPHPKLLDQKQGAALATALADRSIRLLKQVSVIAGFCLVVLVTSK